MTMLALYEVLATKLSAIDRDCESAALVEIRSLHSQAAYDGGRFRVPSFQEVTSVWLRLIKRKEKEFCAEIARLLSSGQLQPDEAFFASATTLTENYFSEHLFANRLKLFIDGIERKASSYGLKFDAQAHRIDLTAAAYAAEVKNRLSDARKNTHAELMRFNKDSISQKERLHIEDIDQFRSVRSINPEKINGLLTNGYWDVGEDYVQLRFEEILEISYHKVDWGGEYNDLYSANLSVDGRRMVAAFMLKGRGLRKKSLEISGCGKNGDQLVRLFESPAQIYVIQFVGEISEAVIKDVEGKVREKRVAGREAWCCVINGQDTARLFHAYGKI